MFDNLLIFHNWIIIFDLPPVCLMEHIFFTTQSRLCRAEAEHRALSLKTQWLLLGIFVQKKFLRPISVLGTTKE